MKRFILFCAVLAAFTASAGAQGVGFGVQADFVNFNLGVATPPLTIPHSTIDYGSLITQIYGLGYGGGIHFDLDMGFPCLRDRRCGARGN
jgi:hypothetical protein